MKDDKGKCGGKHMAGTVMDTAKQVQAQSAQLMDRIRKGQSDLNEILQQVRQTERDAIEKTKEEQRLLEEKKRQERLLEVLSSDKDLAAHIGEDRPDATEEAVVQPTSADLSDQPAALEKETNTGVFEPAHDAKKTAGE